MTYRDRDRVMRWLEAGHGEKLTLLDRVILRDLAEAANSETGHAWLGQDTLSARWGVTTRAVKLSITRLHQHGLLATAEPGRWHRRARYVLAGELDRGNEDSPYTGGTTVPPVGSTGGTSVPYRGNGGSPQGERAFPHRGNERSPVSVVITEESLNHPRGRSDSAGAPSPAADGQMDGFGQDLNGDNRTPQWAIEADLLKAAAEGDRSELMDIVAGEREMVQEIAARLGMSEDDAEDWVVDTLEGRQIKSVRGYLKTCMRNYTPPARQEQRVPPATKVHHNEPWNLCDWCKGAMILGLDSYPVDSPEYEESVRQAKDMIEAQARKEGGYYYHPTCWPACPKCAAPWSRLRAWPDDGICSRCKETP